MTGLKRNSVFCFPETLNVPRGEPAPRGTLLSPRGNKTHCSPRDQSLSVAPPNSKIEKMRKNCLLEATDLPQFQFKEQDLITCESKV